MTILALDTTTRAGSVAVARDGVLIREHSGDRVQTHGQRLPGDMLQTLGDAGIRIDDVRLLAVAAGPGSFTGLRVGVATIQGLAVARGLKVVPVPTLEALARAAAASDVVASAFRPNEPLLVAAWMDGQRGEVFGALYEVLPPDTDRPPDQPPPRLRRSAGALRAKAESGSDQKEIRPPIAGSPAAVLDSWALPADSPIVFIGDGAVRYRAALAERFGEGLPIIPPPLLAATIARIAFEQPQRAVEPHEIVPVYVRRSDAELARQRRNPGAQGDLDRGARRSGLIEQVTSARDLDAVAALEALCFTNPWTREMLEREVRHSNVARVYVLRDADGGLVAFCTCWLIADELHINTIAVDPGRRRTGLATSLMQQVMEAAARSGATRATLEVRASNEPARRLYASLGFAEAGVRPLYYSQPAEDAVILWRNRLE